jgi:hypothetical protein
MKPESGEKKVEGDKEKKSETPKPEGKKEK